MQPGPSAAPLLNGSCPELSELADLICGRLSAARHEQLEDHVAECATCRQQFEQIDESADPLIDRLFDAEVPPIPDDAQFHEVVQHLKSAGPVAKGAAVTTGELTTSSTLGDFRIVREIGRGGMGVVFEAEQISLGRRVALKTLPFAPLRDERRRERFQHEARAAASLRHPHIVQVHAVGVERGLHYYAMELINGRNLSQMISELRRSNVGADTPDQIPERGSGGPKPLARTLAERVVDAPRERRNDVISRNVREKVSGSGGRGSHRATSKGKPSFSIGSAGASPSQHDDAHRRQPSLEPEALQRTESIPGRTSLHSVRSRRSRSSGSRRLKDSSMRTSRASCIATSSHRT